MRIWHQAFVNLGDTPDYKAALETQIKGIVRPDTEVVVRGSLPGTFGKGAPLGDMQYDAVGNIHALQTLAAAIAAEQQGFDAFSLGLLPTLAMREARSTVSIPVVNYGEAACHFASFYGRRFGIIRFAADLVAHTAELVRKLGCEAQFAGAAAGGISYNDVLTRFNDPGDIVERFQEAVRKFVKESGADVIIPGELPMGVFLASQGISRVDDVPIVNGLAVTLKLAEMMVDLRNSFGMTHSRQGVANRAPPMSRIGEVVDFYGMGDVWRAIGVDTDGMV